MTDSIFNGLGLSDLKSIDNSSPPSIQKEQIKDINTPVKSPTTNIIDGLDLESDKLDNVMSKINNTFKTKNRVKELSIDLHSIDSNASLQNTSDLHSYILDRKKIATNLNTAFKGSVSKAVSGDNEKTKNTGATVKGEFDLAINTIINEKILLNGFTTLNRININQLQVLKNINKFNTSIFTNYLSQSLSLQYKQTALTKDLLNVTRAVGAIIEGKLDAIKINTSLSIPKKESMIDHIKGSIKKSFYDKIGRTVIDTGYDLGKKHLFDPTLTAVKDISSGRKSVKQVKDELSAHMKKQYDHYSKKTIDLKRHSFDVARRNGGKRTENVLDFLDDSGSYVKNKSMAAYSFTLDKLHEFNESDFKKDIINKYDTTSRRIGVNARNYKRKFDHLHLKDHIEEFMSDMTPDMIKRLANDKKLRDRYFRAKKKHIQDFINKNKTDLGAHYREVEKSLKDKVTCFEQYVDSNEFVHKNQVRYKALKRKIKRTDFKKEITNSKKSIGNRLTNIKNSIFDDNDIHDDITEDYVNSSHSNKSHIANDDIEILKLYINEINNYNRTGSGKIPSDVKKLANELGLIKKQSVKNKVRNLSSRYIPKAASKSEFTRITKNVRSTTTNSYNTAKDKVRDTYNSITEDGVLNKISKLKSGIGNKIPLSEETRDKILSYLPEINALAAGKKIAGVPLDVLEICGEAGILPSKIVSVARLADKAVDKGYLHHSAKGVTKRVLKGQLAYGTGGLGGSSEGNGIYGGGVNIDLNPLKESIDSFHQSFRTFSAASLKVFKSMQTGSGATGNGSGSINTVQEKTRMQKIMGKLKFWKKDNTPNNKPEEIGDIHKLFKAATTVVGGSASVYGKYLKFMGHIPAFGTKVLFGKHENDPFVDVYRKDQRDAGHPLVTKKQLEKGCYFKDGNPVRNVSYIKEPIFDKKGNMLVSEEDIKAGLVDIRGKNIANRKFTISRFGKMADITGMLGSKALGITGSLAKVYGHTLLGLGKAGFGAAKFLGGKAVDLLNGDAVKTLTKGGVGLAGVLGKMYGGMFGMGLKGLGGAGKFGTGLLGNMLGFNKGGGNKKDLEEIVGRRLDTIIGILHGSHIPVPPNSGRNRFNRVVGGMHNVANLNKTVRNKLNAVMRTTSQLRPRAESHIEQNADRHPALMNIVSANSLNHYANMQHTPANNVDHDNNDEHHDSTAETLIELAIGNYLKDKAIKGGKYVFGKTATGAKFIGKGVGKGVSLAAKGVGASAKVAGKGAMIVGKGAAKGTSAVVKGVINVLGKTKYGRMVSAAALTAGAGYAAYKGMNRADTRAKEDQRSLYGSAGGAARNAVATDAAVYGAAAVGSKLISKAAGKLGIDIGAKLAARAGAKLIPGVGLVLGTASAVMRARRGDYLGSVLEFASGLVSTVPFVGTAISVGIDGYLAYRDYNNSYKVADHSQKFITKDRVTAYGFDVRYKEDVLQLEHDVHVAMSEKGAKVTKSRLSSFAKLFGLPDLSKDPIAYKYFLLWYNNRFVNIFSRYCAILKSFGLQYSVQDEVDKNTMNKVIPEFQKQTANIVNQHKSLVLSKSAFDKYKADYEKSEKDKQQKDKDKLHPKTVPNTTTDNKDNSNLKVLTALEVSKLKTTQVNKISPEHFPDKNSNSNSNSNKSTKKVVASHVMTPAEVIANRSNKLHEDSPRGFDRATKTVKENNPRDIAKFNKKVVETSVDQSSTVSKYVKAKDDEYGPHMPSGPANDNSKTVVGNDNTALISKAKTAVAAPSTPSSPDSLGSLSAKFESSAKGSSAVGYDKVGGTSYGKYQIASAVGTFSAFIKFLKSQPGNGPIVAQRLESAGRANTGSKSGTVPDEWKKIVSEGLMSDYEHAFIKKTIYDKALDKIKGKAREYVDKFKAVQQVLWSTAVGSGAGGAANIFNSVGEKAQNVSEFIKAVYEKRSTKYGSSTAGVQASMVNRFKDESKLALGMIGGEGDSTMQVASASTPSAPTTDTKQAPASSGGTQPVQTASASSDSSGIAGSGPSVGETQASQSIAKQSMPSSSGGNSLAMNAFNGMDNTVSTSNTVAQRRGAVASTAARNSTMSANSTARDITTTANTVADTAKSIASLTNVMKTAFGVKQDGTSIMHDMHKTLATNTKQPPMVNMPISTHQDNRTQVSHNEESGNKDAYDGFGINIQKQMVG